MFEDIIKSKRKELGLTQKEFAKKLNIPYRTYQDWENGRHQPTQILQTAVLKMIDEF